MNMTRIRRRVGLGATAVLSASLLLGSCSSSEPDGAPSPSPSTELTTTAPAAAPGENAGGPNANPPRQSCAVDTLAAAASASFAAPALQDLVCETNFAAATLNNGSEGEAIVLFGLENGVWTLLASGPVGDAAAAAPGGFSATAIPEWQRLRNARANRQQPRSGGGDSGSGRNPTADDPLNGCKPEGDVYICPETTVVTAPVDPDAPTTTAPQSGFCKYNYIDPRCVADPTFTP